MNHTTLDAFENFPYFTISGFRQIAGEAVSNDRHARVALARWVKAGHILRLKRGVYMHRRFYERNRQMPEFSMMVSAILLPQSYLSLEYVLQQHGVLTEVTYPVTAVTTKNTRRIVNELGTFVYRHIHPSLYQGFQMREVHGVACAIASPAKALFDYLYLRPLAPGGPSAAVNLAEELRLNLTDFSPQAREEFAGYVRFSGKPKMRRILANLERHVWQP